MACKYYLYKNKPKDKNQLADIDFENELVLDTWIQEKVFANGLELTDWLMSGAGKFLLKGPEFKDIIFSASVPAAKTYDALMQNDALFKQLQKDKHVTFEITIDELENDIERYECTPPVIGTTTFLQTLETSPGHPIFPLFKPEEYWKHKFELLANGDIAEDEKKELREILGRENVDAISNPADLKVIRDEYTKKWRDLGRNGNTTHEVMRLYFGAKDLNGRRIKNQKPEEILKYVKQSLADTMKANPDKYAQVSDSVLLETINYAKSLEEDLKNKFGKNAIFLPEFRVFTGINEMEVIHPKTGKQTKYNAIQGIIDLLVISEDGRALIVDYKTSPKDYASGEYDSAKVLTFKYQLATYKRILQRIGLNLDAYSGVYLAPIRYNNYRKGDDGNWTYDSITPHFKQASLSSTKHLVDLTSEIESSSEAININSNLDTIVPVPITSKVTPGETLAYTLKCMASSFKDHNFGEDVTDKEVEHFIKRKGIDKPDKEGYYHFTLHYPKKEVRQSKDLFELVPYIKEELQERKKAGKRITQSYKHEIIDARKDGDIKRLFNIKGVSLGSQEWLTNKLLKYLDENEWELLGEDNSDYENFEELGMLLFKNKYTGQIEIIKFSSRELDMPCRINGRKYLTGAFLPDIVEDKKTNTLILESNYGNIELMEAMTALNVNPQLFDNFNAVIGSIQVINPYSGIGKTASNKELFYNFNLLARLNPDFGENNFTFENKLNKLRVTLLTTVELVRYDLYYLLDRSRIKGYNTALNANADNKGRKPVDSEVQTERKQRMSSDFSDYSKIYSELAESVDGSDMQIVRAKLLELNDKLERDFKYLKTVQRGDYNEEQKPERRLQRLIFEAISEIDGYDQRQQNRDDARYSENVRKVLTEGHSGTYLDNQGFLSNPALNRLAKATTIAYLNTRDTVQKVKNSLRDTQQKLKQETGYNWLSTRTVGNQTSMYHDMYDWSRTDDFMFVEPNTLYGAKKEYLEKALYIINANRLISDPAKRRDPAYVKSYLDKFRYSEDINERDKFFRVPLKPGSGRALAANKVGLHGLFNCLKDKLNAWNPKTIVLDYKKKFEDFIDETGEDQERKIKDNALWHMVNRFNKSEGNYRLEYLKELGGPEACETNLEELVLEHTFAYALQENIDAILPMIRATMMNVAVNEYTLNADFSQTFEYIAKYVRNKIFNQSLASDDARSAKLFIGKLLSFTSKLALAFSPYQIYQCVDGIWKDISLWIRKPDGNTSFTFLNLKDSFWYSYHDLVHYGDGNSLLEQLNEFYGINDMDMNQYVDKIRSDLGGIFNFTSLMFRMASRPDFYNRMVIFLSQMRGDGCWDAHYVKDGKLVYDFTKDMRFDLFATTSLEDAKKLTGEQLEKYNQLKAMYRAMAEQMIREKTRDANGELFTLDKESKYPIPLPKAYTTELSEGMKALGDMIYGYYSHEKKSLWQSTTIGSMVMQMQTYWSSKKNQYMAPGGIKYMGRMELYEEPKLDENGKAIVGSDGYYVTNKYWEVIGEDGKTERIVSDEERDADPELKSKTIPLMRWKGLYHEGIFVTFMNMFRYFKNSEENTFKDKFLDMHNYYWNNPDENLRRAYRNNIKQFWVDFLGWLIIGIIVGPLLQSLADDYAKDNKNETLKLASVNTALALSAHIIESSGKDFNALESIGGLGVTWTPFSVSMLTRTVKNLSQVIGGDKSFYDALVNSATATRSTKPMWDYIKGDADWGKSRNLIARENGELDE